MGSDGLVVETASPLSGIEDPSDDNIDVFARLGGSTFPYDAITPKNLYACMNNESRLTYIGYPCVVMKRIEKSLLDASAREMAENDAYWLKQYGGKMWDAPPEERRSGPVPIDRVRFVDGPAAVKDPSKAEAAVEITTPVGAFRILACTPNRLEELMDAEKLEYDFGSLIVFVKELTMDALNEAAAEMAEFGGWDLKRFSIGRGFYRRVQALREKYARLGT
jgi:hypothetical protein